MGEFFSMGCRIACSLAKNPYTIDGLTGFLKIVLISSEKKYFLLPFQIVPNRVQQFLACHGVIQTTVDNSKRKSSLAGVTQYVCAKFSTFSAFCLGNVNAIKMTLSDDSS